MKKNCEQLINNIIGQLEGVKKMMKNDEKSCFDVLIQMKAAKSSFGKVMTDFLSEKMEQCASQKNEKEKEEFNKLLQEIIKQ